MAVFTKGTDCGLLSWSSLVLAMNFAGSFSYKQATGKNDELVYQSPQHVRQHNDGIFPGRLLRYSNLTFLWGVFVCVLRLACGSMLLMTVFVPLYNDADIATMTIVYSCSAWIMTWVLIPVIMLARSRQLADILQQIESTSSSSSGGGGEGQEEDIQVAPIWNKLRKLSNLIRVLLMVGSNVYSYWYSFRVAEMNTLMEMMTFGLFFPCFYTGIYATMELTENSLSLWSRQLVASANFSLKTLKQVTWLTGKEVTSEEEGQRVDVIMKSLHYMDRQIRLVEYQREKVLSYLFPVLSLSLLMNTLTLTASVYAILNGSFLKGITLIFMGMTCTVLAHHCHIGGAFVSQVDEAVGILNELKCTTSNPSIVTRVCQLVAGMAGLQRFSVCGWYCLDYSTLLTVGNTVVTYLVVLLQFDK
ncbi:hypothetical protein Pmani_024473 [Petrolisthes manimaculis]|uniref:Gustatory receptor n=1 Tax=Petrolisthes manimaculis TaxID=1843537 RepID=A0AAE1P7Q4_9EUCA|nr:hypothetical protein Pmani_024473 [Petrolisthes manimaculis]